MFPLIDERQEAESADILGDSFSAWILGKREGFWAPPVSQLTLEYASIVD